MKLWSAPLSRTVTLAAVAVAATAALTACGTSSGTAGAGSPTPSAGASGAAGMASPGMSGGLTGMGSSPSSSAMGSGMGGGMDSSPSASGMGQGMGTDAPSTGAMGTPAAGPHNAADVAFTTGMIPHHTQAVAMADLAATRAKSPQVKALAAQIKAAQGPEITEMSGWLRGWAVAVPTGDMSGMAMTGMMSAADMANLAKLSGTAFDRTWLAMMTTHHQGAVTMAQTELKAGANPDAKTLARSITSSQTAQIGQMKTLLTRLPTS